MSSGSALSRVMSFQEGECSSGVPSVLSKSMGVERPIDGRVSLILMFGAPSRCSLDGVSVAKENQANGLFDAAMDIPNSSGMVTTFEGRKIRSLLGSVPTVAILAPLSSES